jgi:hypothetical protein
MAVGSCTEVPNKADVLQERRRMWAHFRLLQAAVGLSCGELRSTAGQAKAYPTYPRVFQRVETRLIRSIASIMLESEFA